MACNCGGSTTSTSGSSVQLNPAPDPGGSVAPDGTPIGKDISKGGQVPAYGSPGGAGVAGPGGGYQAAGTQHATGLGAHIGAPNGAVSPDAAGLARKYESSGDYGAVSTNSNDPGGPSYGAYQIATKPGTMNNFLNQLQTTDPSAYAALQNAGGATAALSGDPAFIQAWKDQAANNPNFAKDQDAFIQATHYDPAVTRIQALTGLDVNGQSLGVQQAIYSWAVQSPNGMPNSLAAALHGQDISAMSQKDLVNAIYDARAASIANTSSLNSSIIANRYVAERKDALSATSTVPSLVSNPPVVNEQIGV